MYSSFYPASVATPTLHSSAVVGVQIRDNAPCQEEREARREGTEDSG